MKNSVSVIIPTLNGGDLFRQSLEMIFTQEIGFQLEIIVVDSGSSDQTIELCRKYPVKLIQIPLSSFNHSATRNLAISVARSDLCVLTVQDAVPVDKKWLAALVEPLMKNDRVAGVFGQQVSSLDSSALSRCCKLLWYQAWRGDWCQEREQLPVEMVDWENFLPEQKRNVARFDNVNSCIRKSVWSEIPFPDVPYGEDIAWAQAALTSGYTIFWQPNARVFHSHNRSLAYEFKRSYVDMKMLTNVFDDCPMVISLQVANSVLRWMAEEAQRFLQKKECGELSGGSEKTFKWLETADCIWQESNKGRYQDGEVGVNISNALLHYFYKCLSGPEWLRAAGRNVINKRSGKDENNSMRGIACPVLEIQGRHRFFVNQLLNVYYTEKTSSKDAVHSIRLGAAVMVGGSFLGQYMSGLDVSTGAGVKSGDRGKRGSMHQDTFWQALDQWCNQDFDGGNEGLLQLDAMLRGGV